MSTETFLYSEIEHITITVKYRDEDGEPQYVSKSAKSFESATENLGKLERFFQVKGMSI